MEIHAFVIEFGMIVWTAGSMYQILHNNWMKSAEKRRYY